ncbi:MAG: phosphate transport system regulatory protein PhoU [Ignavibacteriales bacterium]|nr:MAG: phosphate transport system regulatory protein PhoU [Ignavibacteriales bacterium]
MQEHFSEEIENLKTSLIKMASIVDEQVDKVITALESGNIELCKGVKSKDLEVDAYDNLIQTQCENILALFQPVASDLRLVMSAIMINNNLERCGDIAVNISQRVKKAGNERSLISESQIVDMARTAQEMLKNSIDSFIKNDTELASKVIASDEKVDKLNKQVFNFLVAKMQTHNELIEACTHLIVMSRNIERLADHATNIAENLVFYVDAQIIAHRKKLERS